jgi:hypothetical protein
VTIRLLCPSCATDVTLDDGLQSATCPECLHWLHAIECSGCQHTFVALGARTQQCPRCATSVRFSEARLRTLADARDPDTGAVLIVERRVPPVTRAARRPPRSLLSSTRLPPRGPLSSIRLPPRGWANDPRGVPRFLVRFFAVLTWVVILAGVISTLAFDAVLVRYHHSFGTVLIATCAGLASTAVSAAFVAFFSYALAMLLELVERPSVTSTFQRTERASNLELRD